MSNPVEKAQQLGQTLFDIQTSTMSELVTMQQKNLEKYLEMTRECSTKLSEASDPQRMMEMQREMAQSLW